VGLFGGQRVGHFFGGGHFGVIGPFLAHFRPNGSNRERERESIFYFWALRQPAWPLGTPQEGGWWGGTKGATGGRVRDGQPPSPFKKKKEEGTCNSSLIKIIFRPIIYWLMLRF
jgi:hypothetical protein